VGGEHRHARVIEGDQAHQRVVVRPFAADLLGVDPSGLVAVVPVGDQELGIGELAGDRLVDGGIVNPPHAVLGSLVVGDLSPWLRVQGGLDVPPGVAGVQGEDRGEVVAGGAREPQAVLLGSRLGALVRAHQARTVRRHPHPREESAALVPPPVRAGELLGQRPDRLVAIGAEDALQDPGVEGLRRMLVGIPVGRSLWEVDLDDVERRALQKPPAELGVDDVVRRRGHVRE
jgi:hypothetical protein